MKKYIVNVSQNGGEYYGDIFIKCNNLEQIDIHTIKVNDEIEINFDYELIEKITDQSNPLKII